MQRQILAALVFTQLALSPTRAAAREVKVIDDYVPCQLTAKQDAAMRSRTPETVLSDAVARQSALGRIADPAGFTSAMKGSSNFDQAFGQASKYLQDGKETRDKVKKDLEEPFKEAQRAAIQRPDDIGCSQSLLSWEEASDIFGRRIANTYLAFQVVVRNLSPDNEFVMHDVKIALDSPYSRFVAGRDKMLARGVALRGQSDDPRNVWMRVGDAVASVAGAASVAFTGINFKNGVTVFQSAFLPGMKSTFPDYTIEQMNRLSDLAFTSSSAYKIVIPKSGSAPFVTFLPAKIFAGDGTSQPAPYKKWSQQKLLAFSNSAFVIVAGVHVKEVDNQPSVSKLTCPVDASGALDLAKAKGDTFSCDVAGDNLDGTLKLRLKNAAESNDAVTAEGTLTIAGKDTTAAKVAFKLSDLKALKAADYSVYLVEDASNETPTGLSVKIRQQK